MDGRGSMRGAAPANEIHRFVVAMGFSGPGGVRPAVSRICVYKHSAHRMRDPAPRTPIQHATWQPKPIMRGKSATKHADNTETWYTSRTAAGDIARPVRADIERAFPGRQLSGRPGGRQTCIP